MATFRVAASGANPTTFAISGPGQSYNHGTIDVRGGSTLALTAMTLDNTGGRIEAIGAGSTIALSHSSILSGSLDIASAGTVVDASGANNAILGTTITNRGLIVAEADTALALKDDVVDGAGGTIKAVGDNTLVTIAGTSLSGGTLETTAMSGNGGIEFIAGFGASLLDGGTSTIKLKSSKAMAVQDGATLILAGVINMSGQLALEPYGNGATLQISGATTTSGGGGFLGPAIHLAGDGTGAIASNGSDALLTNATWILGTGSIGDSHLDIVNQRQGTIQTDQLRVLDLTPARPIINGGLLGAQVNGTLELGGTIENAGGTIQSRDGASSRCPRRCPDLRRHTDGGSRQSSR